MGSHGGSRAGGSSGGGSANTSSSNSRNSNISAQELTMLNNLNVDSSRSEIRSALETLDVGTSFYTVSEREGELLGSTHIVKTGEDSFTINGNAKELRDVTKLLYENGGAKQAEKPDTSSHVKITGTRTRTVDGLKFKDGTYDVYKNINAAGKGRKPRKFEQSGKITSYDGVQYGVAKSGGEYFTTHIPTGFLIGRGQKNMSGVVAQIKDTHERLIKGRQDLAKSEKKFKNTLRGD